MQRRRFSPTYSAILDLLHRTEISPNNMYKTEINGATIRRTKTGEVTFRPNQEIIITDTTLFGKCTSAQWHLIGLICSELKDNNALWYCDPNTKRGNTARVAIKGLIAMEILIKTETPHIYLVNPLHIRKGDFHATLITTAKMLSTVPKVLQEHITRKKPVEEFERPDVIARSSNTGYGFSDPDED